MKLAAFVLLCILWVAPTHANNIQIDNGQIVQVGADRFIEFDLSWENSWRVANLGHGVGNWDAAWVFVKYRVPAAQGGDDLWKHVWLSTNDNDHNPGTGTAATINVGTTDISVTPRGMGAFIYRSSNGTGTFSTTGTRLRWDVSAQEGYLGFSSTQSVEIRIFAIEMVYVPGGSFQVGDGTTSAVAGQFRNGSTNTPLTISSENALTLGGTSNGDLNNNNALGMPVGSTDDFNNTTTRTLPAAFPKGTVDFYSMKYSTSQRQYVDFLNTLTRTQQEERFSSTTVGSFMDNTTTPPNRNGVRLMSDPGGAAPRVFGNDLNGNNIAGESADGQWIAMGWTTWMDAAAYMDWSGLRPMTELEFEKAARGPVTPEANEYAWGTASIASSAYTLNNSGQATESIAANYSTTAGNAMSISTRGNTIGGPLRVGIFATGSSTRVQAGASYWGIMELSGNVWDRTVTVGNTAGRNFTGLHGDGMLTTNGHGNVINWPGLVSGEITGAAGSAFRGGTWASSTVDRLRVSDRFFGAAARTGRFSDYGFRGVRSAPAAGGGN